MRGLVILIRKLILSYQKPRFEVGQKVKFRPTKAIGTVTGMEISTLSITPERVYFVKIPKYKITKVSESLLEEA